MHGIQELPALFFDNLQKTLNKMGLETYDVLYNNPLHYIFHYMQNIYMNCQNTCLKYKKSSNKFIHASFIRKDAKNFLNYNEVY